MPEAYYIIPIIAGPYSRTNPLRPDYVDSIQCNFSGRQVEALGIFVCMVNTTEAKHSLLASQPGVRQLPRGYTWNTVLSTLPPAARNAISNWCNSKNIPYDSAETIGELLMRLVNSGIFDLGATPLTTEYRNMTASQQDRIRYFCQKHGQAEPLVTDTVGQISKRLGRISWPGDDRSQVMIEEF